MPWWVWAIIGRALLVVGAVIYVVLYLIYLASIASMGGH